MAVMYKNTWVGKYPCVIILTDDDVHRVLYYETGFEQLHPLPEIHKWMEERNYEYYVNWKVLREYEDRGKVSAWIIAFDDENIAQMFMLKWL